MYTITDAEPLDMTGTWLVSHRVISSARPDFVGLDIQFQINFSQDGQQLAGDGEKFLVDSHPASPDEISRLAITGWVRDVDVRISLMELSLQRPARTIIGEIVWTATNRDRMVGSFRVDLAETSGRSEAVRDVR
jgi:hypothetical protein